MSKQLELKDISGVGPAAVTKLKKAGIKSVMDLASMSLEDVSIYVGCSKDKAAEYIEKAQDLLKENDIIGNDFIDGDVLMTERENLARIKTGLSTFDDFLLGGIETEAITELYGEYGSGKSQISHVMSVRAGLPVDQGGLDSNVIFIDTEKTFRPERIRDIAEGLGLDPKTVQKKIKVCRVRNSTHLEFIMRNLANFLEEYAPVKLVIVDSIIALHRADFSGRGTLADRQQRLNQILHRLLRIAEIYKVAVIITNQVSSSPDQFYGDPVKATGGNIIGHNSTYRIYLKKSGQNRIAEMVDSPYHERISLRFSINKTGLQEEIVKT